MPFIGNQPALSYTSFAKQDFSTSATTTYTLDNPVANANELALFINFVRQEPTTAYSASGTTLTLTEATSSSDDMYCVYLGKAVQTVTPANNSVTNAMLSAGSFSNITGVGTLSNGLTLSDNILFDTANKGIYLGVTSATASNLLDDYEEGTFTPTYSTSGTDFSSVTYDSITEGYYTKIGNTCYLQVLIRTDAITIGSASGLGVIGNLPFISGSNNQSSLYVGYSASFAVDNPSAAIITPSSSVIYLYSRATSNGNTVNLTPADFATGTNDNLIYLGGFYIID
jgi:hypothetical protein